MWGKGLAVQQYHLLKTLLGVFTPRNLIPTENTRGFFNIQTRFGPYLQHPMQWVRETPNALRPGTGRTYKGEFVSCRVGIGYGMHRVR